MTSSIWLNAAVLPFLLVFGASLSSRFAVSGNVNRRFLALTWSTFLAASLDVALRLMNLLSPLGRPLITMGYALAVNISAYCLMRYVAAYVHQGEWRGLKFNTFLLWLSAV
ncbi:MAG: hypothetical protein IJ702_00980, partial [Fretibacterium sp.]|nr:hypothetical protein [Fretibacterium sp.]